jgi:hypothetical protein
LISLDVPSLGGRLPEAPLLSLELRFVLQHRHDEGDGVINPFHWRTMVERLDTLGAVSLLDHDVDWWVSQGRGTPRSMSYISYAWRVLSAFRVRRGLADPWAQDVWHSTALPIDRAGRGRVAFDWRAIRPPWLRELCKRWARHRLRGGLSTGQVSAARLATLRLVEFCESAGWPLDDEELPDPRAVRRIS